MSPVHQLLEFARQRHAYFTADPCQRCNHPLREEHATQHCTRCGWRGEAGEPAHGVGSLQGYRPLMAHASPLHA